MDFRWLGEVALLQYNFLKKMHNGLPKSMKNGYRNTPAPKNQNLFKIDLNDKKLDNVWKQEYNHVAAQTLLASQRSRPDVKLATGFHCNHVKCPSEEDWKKMTNLQKYIWKTIFLP